MSASLVGTLIDRLYDAGAKHKLEELLRTIKEKQGVQRKAFRISGTPVDLKVAALQAFEQGHLRAERLAELVDAVEETGGQHILLFNLTDEGRRAFAEARLSANLPSVPKQPTEALYSELPASKRTFYLKRGQLQVVKQVYCATFWELDKEESSQTDDRRVEVFKRVRKRAINSVVVDLATGTAEIRVDRIRGQADEKLAMKALQEFGESLGDRVDMQAHLIPLPIWDGFGQIVAATAETYMNTDEAHDPSVIHRISNWRARERGTDVRQHPSWVLGGDAYQRQVLSIYWLLPPPPDQTEIPEEPPPPRRVHTVLSKASFGGRDLGKVYVAAKIEPSELRHVLDRVRHFTP